MILMLVLTLLLGFLATLVGLPGNWLMVIGMAACAYFGLPEHGAGAWPYVITAFVLALLAEAVELAASAAGLAKGGSKRGALLAVVGAVGGSLVGATLGLPIPIVGSVIGILLCSSIGAMGGAMIGELWKGKNLGTSVTIGRAAFFGRLIGSVAKLVCGALIVAAGITMLVQVG